MCVYWCVQSVPDDYHVHESLSCAKRRGTKSILIISINLSSVILHRSLLFFLTFRTLFYFYMLFINSLIHCFFLNKQFWSWAFVGFLNFSTLMVGIDRLSRLFKPLSTSPTAILFILLVCLVQPPLSLLKIFNSNEFCNNFYYDT